MLTRMAGQSGVATLTIDDLVRLDRKRKGKKLSNEDWTSPTDPFAETLGEISSISKRSDHDGKGARGDCR
jgi:hypothetical protein